MSLVDYGWGPFFAESFRPYESKGFLPARVMVERRGWLRLSMEEGEVDARPTGRLRHHAEGRQDLPSIGDWVVVRPPSGGRSTTRIHALLPRRTKLSRRGPGSRLEEQVLAANVDQVFVVMGLDADFNLRRGERFLTMVRESGAEPVVVLNKADLARDWTTPATEVQSATPGVDVLVMSCQTGQGLEAIRRRFKRGHTTALVGSSGVGKSSLVNRLCGSEVMRTAAVRAADDRGRHTTSHRQLILLPGTGGLLIDTPGVRELQPWELGRGLDDAFEDIGDLAAKCQFRNCGHSKEPGCEVLAAVEGGGLSRQRLQHYRLLQDELGTLVMRRRRIPRSVKPHQP